MSHPLSDPEHLEAYQRGYDQGFADGSLSREAEQSVVLATEKGLTTTGQKIAADERDAERYRWLRQDNGEDKPFVGRYDGRAFSRWTNEHADECIDAAMSVRTGCTSRKSLMRTLRPMIWWHKYRLRHAEMDMLEAMGIIASLSDSWCQYTYQEAEAKKLIAEGRMAYHRLKLGLNPFNGDLGEGEK